MPIKRRKAPTCTDCNVKTTRSCDQARVLTYTTRDVVCPSCSFVGYQSWARKTLVKGVVARIISGKCGDCPSFVKCVTLEVVDD